MSMPYCVLGFGIQCQVLLPPASLVLWLSAQCRLNLIHIKLSHYIQTEHPLQQGTKAHALIYRSNEEPISLRRYILPTFDGHFVSYVRRFRIYLFVSLPKRDRKLGNILLKYILISEF